MPALALFLLAMIPGTFFLGIYDILTKKNFKNNIRSGLLLGSTWFFSGLIILSVSYVIGIPELQPGFWQAFIVTAILNCISQLLWYRAIKREDASLVAPLRLITPPLVLITGYLTLREVPSGWGIVGVISVVAGLFLLLQSEINGSDTKIFHLLKRPGLLYGIIAAILFAISFPFDKKAVLLSSGLFFPGLLFLTVGSAHLIWDCVRYGGKNRLSALRSLGTLYPLAVLAHSAGGFLTIQALNYSFAAYAASLKRLWSFWAVILSGKFLGEKNIGKRLLATFIMLAGIALTVILG